ncbi:MAG TPA: hypothetical protein PLA90_09835, partial [Candidatus Sumerlaeota bacterium]|nr:hypothetical protein [Candidatus Sumerlaeota bacterium]
MKGEKGSREDTFSPFSIIHCPLSLKTAVEDRNESFVLTFRAENGLGFLSFGVKSFDRANREIGGPGNR